MKDRIRNALWGLFVADALAMPAHWYYNRNTLKKAFPEGMAVLQAPPHPHPEAFMVGMAYRPEVKRAKELGRPYDILHQHVRFYQTSYSELAIDRTEREGEHGNAVASAQERYHYHHGLKAGDNTLGAKLVRLLLRSIVRAEGYSEKRFLSDFVSWMTSSEGREDPYTEIYLRRWFENFSRGREPELCAASQRDIWSIGSNGGLVRPLVLALTGRSAFEGLGLSVQHAALTHRSQNLVSALGVLVPLLHALISGSEPRASVLRAASRIRLAKVHGDELFAAYRAHRGPGNIPRNLMWKYHTEFEEGPFPIEEWAVRPEEEIASRVGTACYTEQGVPLALALAMKHDFEPRRSLPADLFCGGDNVHRGMVHGLVVGAAGGEIPQAWKEGLTARAELDHEIEAFVAML